MQVIVICLVPYLISFVKKVDTNLQARSFYRKILSPISVRPIGQLPGLLTV